jgi:hypothetical protein
MKELDKNRFLSASKRLMELIEDDLRAPASAETGSVDRFDLEVASKHICQMQDNVKNDTLPPKEMRFPILARLILDQWPLRSRLGTEIIELEKLYQLL